MIRILLVDDHAILRSGLRALLELESDMDVVGEASTGEEGVERARALRPQVVVMDIDMPGMGGLEATRQIQAFEQGIRVLVLTSHSEADYLLPVLEAGGSGYVQKTKADEDLIGEANPLEELSEREREVLALTAEGFSSSEVGKKLFLSPKTVDTYRARLMHKLGLTHRSELVRLALKTGMLKADS